MRRSLRRFASSDGNVSAIEGRFEPLTSSGVKGGVSARAEDDMPVENMPRSLLFKVAVSRRGSMAGRVECGEAASSVNDCGGVLHGELDATIVVGPFLGEETAVAEAEPDMVLER